MVPSNPVILEVAQVEKVTCVICYDDYEKSQMKHPLKCEHIFCQECYNEYFSNKITTNDVRKKENINSYHSSLVIGSEMSQ